MRRAIRMVATSIVCMSLFCACGKPTTNQGTLPIDNAAEQINGIMRVSDGNIQFQDSAGNWNTLCSASEFEQVVHNFRSTDGTLETPSSSPGTTSTVVQGERGATGAKGDKGDTGATGATGAVGPAGPKGEKGDTGATGAPGKDGKDGTQVAIDSDGQLLLDGKPTGYMLIKKINPTPTSTPGPTATTTTEPTSTPTIEPTVEPTQPTDDPYIDPYSGKYKVYFILFDNGKYYSYSDYDYTPSLNDGVYLVKDYASLPKYYSLVDPSQTFTVDGEDTTVIVDIIRTSEPTPLPTYKVTFSLVNRSGESVGDTYTTRLNGGRVNISIYNCSDNDRLGIPYQYSIIAPRSIYVRPEDTNKITLVVDDAMACDAPPDDPGGASLPPDGEIDIGGGEGPTP